MSNNKPTIVRFLEESEVPRSAFPGSSMSVRSEHWMEIREILDSNPTNSGWFHIETYPCRDKEGNNIRKESQSRASSIVQHLSGGKNHNRNTQYIAFRDSPYRYEAITRTWKDDRDILNEKLWEIRVYARALPLEEAKITMPEFGG